MANVIQTNEQKWMLAGIRSEREAVQKRLDYLNEEERRLTNAGFTNSRPAARVGTSRGPAAKPKGKAKAKAVVAPVRTRKRKLSPETREKMRAAAKKRWTNEKAGNQAAAPTPPPVDVDTV